MLQQAKEITPMKNGHDAIIEFDDYIRMVADEIEHERPVLRPRKVLIKTNGDEF